MILSEADKTMEWQNDGQVHKNVCHHHGINALGSLEMLFFAFFSKDELLRVSSVCTAWKTLARDDLFWEPLLLTSVEKYPIRLLLGLERNATHEYNAVPAILVYMVYQRLNIAQTASCMEYKDFAERTVHSATRSYNGRYPDLVQPQNRQRQAERLQQTKRKCRGQQDDALSSVHLVCIKANSTASILRRQQDQEVTQMAAGQRLQTQREDDQSARPTAGVLHREAAIFGDEQPVMVNTQNDAGAGEEEDVYSVADGRDRVTLCAWLSTKKRVNERTLRSFLRQMLLAVDALERANCKHTDISPVNIVVRCESRNKTTLSQDASTSSSGLQVERDESEEEEDERYDCSAYNSAVHGSRPKVLQDNGYYSKRHMPFFQLFISRRNCRQTGGIQESTAHHVLAMDAERNIHARNGNGRRDIVRERQRPAEAEQEIAAGAGVFVNGDNRGAIAAAAFRDQLALPHSSMVSSVIQTAMTVWARGRFADANASSLLAQLLRFPDSFSSSLRSFLEYAKYLIITHSATASKLLRHDYLQCPGAYLHLHSSPHWHTTRPSDVNEYKSKLVAFYGSMPSRMAELLNENAGNYVGPTVMDELMPRTHLGTQYFSEALEEANLCSKRFISVVAPSTTSSSWVRKLACSQSCTLQRLDLSHARVPMSVLLQELAMLPRLTHLRLPKQILRDDNMEHLVAALAFTDLLPHLRGLDTDVRQAMDRMEKSYLMQLDMVTFLLQKPNTSKVSSGAVTNASKKLVLS
ncbi:unnamed protein product [Peronospora belbahrii]|uniref:F-box domain-containing protein n=1 Tax=Peronospora belbahrii TaxID=622444 RepID=A0AAU9LAU6_9STRA|nr:unnamed protein product [Peronospora belbahrii]